MIFNRAELTFWGRRVQESSSISSISAFKAISPFEIGATGFCLLLSSLFAGVYLNLYLGSYGAIANQFVLDGGVTFSSLMACLLMTMPFALIFALIFCCPPRIGLFLFRYRWVIVTCFVLLCTFLGISFSSIGMWDLNLGSSHVDGLIFGHPRAIRTDEYNATTLWNISQEYGGFDPVSSVLQGGAVDTRLVYNSASFSLSSFFRPQLWGYLLFGSERGLAFFWAFRFSALFMSSFEMFRVLTKNKLIGGIFALAITFSPAVVWWGVWEGLIYGQLLVLVYHQLLLSETRISVVYAALLSWLCGCYLLTMYPAWMVPFFYIFALLGVIDAFRLSKDETLLWTRGKTVSLVISVVFLVICLALVFSSSLNALKATAGTVYPGARFSTGGNGGHLVSGSGASLLFGIKDPSVSNPCELSSFFSVCPVGLLICMLASRKKGNRWLVPMLALQLVLFVYVYIGFPPFVSRVTLFSYVPAERAAYAMTYLDSFLLFLGVSSFKGCGYVEADKRKNSLVSVVAVFLIVLASQLLHAVRWGYVGRLYSVLLTVGLLSFLIALCMSMCSIARANASLCLLISIFALVVVPGVCVNPVQKGIGPIQKTDFAQLVSSIVRKEPDALWAVEGNAALGNYCAANGAKTITTTSAYPDFDFWHTIDQEGEYEDYYNRYAHVSLRLVSDGIDFRLIAPDAIEIDLSLDELRRLGIDYLVRKNGASGHQFSNGSLSKISEANGYSVYKLLS